MVLKTEVLQEVCKSILIAVDNQQLNLVSEVIELTLKDSVFTINTTNKEYFVSTNFNVDLPNESFHAVVNASLFLNLVAKLTTEKVELTVDGNSLSISSNGKYRVPIIFEDDHMVELTPIVINNETANFKIKNEILQSIFNYNSKELLKATAPSPANSLYYVDNEGCITYNSGACVNTFTLPSPIKILLQDKVVKLFKLFKDEEINFRLGFDELGEIIQTKIELKDSTTTLSAILSDSAYLAWIPVDAIRNTANSDYLYSMVIDKEEMLSSISRLKLFSGDSNKSVKLLFDINKNTIDIWDIDRVNHETLTLNNEITNLDTTYTCVLYCSDIELTIKNCPDKYLTLKFGNGQSIVVDRNNIKNVITESIQ